MAATSEHGNPPPPTAAVTGEPATPSAHLRRKSKASSKSTGEDDRGLTATTQASVTGDGAVNRAFESDEPALTGHYAHAIEMEPFQSPLSPGVDTAPPSPPEAARQAAAQGKKPGEDEPAWRKHIPYATKIGAALLFHAYLAAGIALTWHKAPDFCSDVKFLTVLTGIVYFFILWYVAAELLDRFASVKDVRRSFVDPLQQADAKYRWLRPSIWALVWGAILTFLIVDSLGDSHRLISLSGIGLLVFLGFAFSNNRLKINWNQVLWGLLLQYLLGLMVLRWGHGRGALQCLSDKIKFFLDYTNQGSHFVFGHLASGFNLTDALGDLVTLVPKPELGANITNGTSHDIKNILPVFMFLALPVVFFFSFFVNILYFYGIMQWMVIVVGKFLHLTIGTTVCESMTAAANIFLGMSEAPLVIRPFFTKMTKSELHSVMTSGFSTIAGSVMAAYISFGVSPAHLMTASIMSAPAALAFAKLLYPETEESKTTIKNIQMPKSEERNVLEAASNGATVGMVIIGHIVSNLVGFLAFLAFLNTMVGWFGAIVALDFLSFEWLLGQIFTPLAFAMGVPWDDCGVVGELIGIKTFANEFIAYSRLSELAKNIQPRSVVIATYALCGFSNFGSIGIMLGAMGAMAPARKGDLAEVSLRALAAGSAACFMTACVAGSLIP